MNGITILESTPSTMVTCSDPHHGGQNKWGYWDGGFWHQTLGKGKWTRVRKVHITPNRVKALNSLIK